MEVITERNCRICLSQCEHRDLDIAKFAMKYFSCTGYTIKDTDVPKKICSTCTSELIIASNFRAKSEETEVILENLLKDVAEESDESPETLEMSLDKFDQVLLNVREELEVKENKKKKVINEPEEDAVIELDDSKEDDSMDDLSNKDPEIYEEIPRFPCDFCEYHINSFKRAFEMKTHTLKCHADQFVLKHCPKCSLKFYSQSTLDFHVNEYHNQNSVKEHFTCTFCEFHSMRAETVQRHAINQHKKQQMFSCVICQKAFRTMDHLRIHVKHTLCGTNILVDEDNDIEYEIKCDFCGFSCALEANMKYHVEKMHPNKPLSRCYCSGKTVYCKDLVAEHLKFKCNKDKKCTSPNTLIQIGIPSRYPKFTSDMDGLTSAERKMMRQREIVACGLCQEKMNRASLQRHITNLHKGVKYICAYCGKTYTLRSSLKAHFLKNHSPTQPQYPCNYCERTFSSWTSRHYHQIRVHTKKFKYECEYCEKKYINQCDYEDHKTFHTGAKIRECEECHEMFQTRENLRTHKKLCHEEPKLLKCNVCPKKYDRESLLKRHVKLKHPNIVHEEKEDQEMEEIDEFEDTESFFDDFINKNRS